MEFAVSLRWNEAEATEIVRRHDGREGRLLPILHDLQAAFGFIPDPAIAFLAQALNVT
ncbi:MAG: Formate dehydrogenase subunit gamma, partial [Reyranella sp.]|nr:Formate dehydrogenase subunit gamma [Reyranella sp.]